ncbi:HAE1 family hydrophobic/amphiphilic exporter-1 [Tumebacillus sp. BK434]|uniref:efflux RND transporter permease subunit n=1 Tax=Tumebacillus sp. BK434 TaxID=2512169 RepID=UPI001051D4BA|nr:efflux RND transporter permease subunit [Tumebacillus sp. BK434]TCP58312.1 HAE1 family hydrophobic/amphiphilic exporter-1 [Tumebacillus sp. BK434]
MNFLTRVSLKNPVAIFILAFLLIFGGTYAFQTLKVDLLPNIEFPQLSIQAFYPGASPDDVNAQVTSKLEEQFKKLDSLDKMTSQSFESASLIQLTFPVGTNMDDVEQKVQDLLREAPLPANVEPSVQRFSFGTFPILSAVAFAKDGQDVQGLLVDEVKPALEKIPGVSSVAVGGTSEELVEIEVNQAEAAKHGLSLQSIQEQIKGKFVSMPAGSVTDDSVLIPIRITEELATVNDLKSLQLNVPSTSGANQGTTGSPAQGGSASDAPGNGPGAAPQPLKLSDIAKIRTITAQPEITRFNDQESIALTVTKKQDANTVEIAEQAREVLSSYSDKVAYDIIFDQSEGIEQSVNSLIKEGLLGALFASLAVLLFLRNLRATIIAVLSIPLSLVVSTIFLAQSNITLNIMTLGGMAVAVGRVVDDSIVVIENIFRRMKNNKDSLDKTELTISATKEMLKAITSSTLTTVVVFLPLGFVGGATGEFFLPFALTIVYALLASLVVSITLTPLLARFSFSKVTHEEKDGRLQRFYERVLRFSLRKKWVVFAICIPLLLGSLGLTSQLGFVFLPNEKVKIVSATVTLPASTVLEKTNEASLKIEEMLKTRPAVQDVFVGIGSRDYMTGLKKENAASYMIMLDETANTADEVKQIEASISDIAKAISDKTVVSVQEMSTGGPPTNNNLDIDLYSTDLDALMTASKQVEDLLKQRTDLKYISNNMKEKQRQWVVKIKPDKASEYGVSAYTVLGITADRTRPVSVGTLELDGEERSVQLTYDKPLASKSELEDLTVFGTKGPVQLKTIADIQEVESVTSIQKLDGKVFARVSGIVNASNVQQTASEVKTEVGQLDLPNGVSLEAGGGTDDTVKTFQELGIAMGIAVGLVYLVMLFTFGQARIPFIILSSLLFVPTGAFIGLYLLNEPLSVSAMIGILMLIGIVVTNAIVLVDRVVQNRDRGLTIRDSLIEGGKTRLRPILMTAFATICALLPLAFTTAEGSLISKGLAVVVIGGLTTSTLLTLIIVPVLYELFFLRTHRKEQKQLLH